MYSGKYSFSIEKSTRLYPASSTITKIKKYFPQDPQRFTAELPALSAMPFSSRLRAVNTCRVKCSPFVLFALKTKKTRACNGLFAFLALALCWCCSARPSVLDLVFSACCPVKTKSDRIILLLNSHNAQKQAFHRQFLAFLCSGSNRFFIC